MLYSACVAKAGEVTLVIVWSTSAPCLPCQDGRRVTCQSGSPARFWECSRTNFDRCPHCVSHVVSRLRCQDGRSDTSHRFSLSLSPGRRVTRQPVSVRLSSPVLAM